MGEGRLLGFLDKNVFIILGYSIIIYFRVGSWGMFIDKYKFLLFKNVFCDRLLRSLF